MAVNKNFVVKHGLEVDNSLIYANATTDKVGIGSTIPGVLFDVDGQLRSKYVNVTGVSSFTSLDISSDVDIDGRTELDVTNIAETLNVTGVSTFVGVGTFVGNLYVGGTFEVKDTLKFNNVTDNTTGNADTGAVQIDGGLGVNKNVTVGAGLSVVGVSTFAGSIDANLNLDVDGRTDLDDLVVTGVSTFSNSIDANLNLDVDGRTDLDDLVVSESRNTSNN